MPSLKLSNPFRRGADRPSLKERAAALKATAGRVMKRRHTQAEVPSANASGTPSPALIGMVAEWKRLLRIEYSGELTDEEMSPICEARYRLHAQICAYPAATVADLAAKLPLFREEIVANEPSDPQRTTMDYQSWCSIVRDLEAVRAPGLAEIDAAPLDLGGNVDGTGFVTYKDSAGYTRRKPVAEWIAYVATRLNGIATNELHRKINAACRDEPDQDANALYDRVRKELRIDALHDLVARSGKVFDVCKGYAVGHRWLAVGDQVDTELLALGREFDAIHAEWTPAAIAQERAEAKAHSRFEDLEKRRGWSVAEAHKASWAEPGLREAVDLSEVVATRMEKVATEIRALPARTLDGLAVKARATIPAFWPRGQHQEDAGLGDDEDWTELNARSLIDECLSLAGVDWTGRRWRPAALLHGEGNPANLTDEIIAGWAEWARAEAEDAQPADDGDRPSDLERDRLLDAAGALPATSDNLAAKALAIAWLEYVHLWRKGWTRDQYSLDGQLTMDVHAAIVSPEASA